jgi:hypothetical protein
MKARQVNRPPARRQHALRAAVALGLVGALAVPTAWAQQKYPDKPIRLVVGYSAGGGVDAVARLLGTRLSTVLGQQVLVETEPAPPASSPPTWWQRPRPTATR